jgi:replicative DNA helicase
MNVGFGKDIESNEEVDFIRIKKDNLSKLFGMDTSSAEIQEGFLSENTEKRLDIYKEVATKGLTDVIPFGIKSLDDSLQGFKRGFLMLVYAKTAGGKTTFAINIAHNVANLGFSVMYVSLEMSYENISAKFDALESRLDSNKIMFGKLTPEELVQYEEALKKQKEKNARLFICDVKRNATMSMICAEIEKYKNKNGKVPDLIVVDYANLLEPTKVYKDRSSKYDYLLKEMHENAKYFNAAFLTMMQESRDSTKTDLTQGRRKKEDNSDEDGVHRIGLSHYAATHCEYVLRLKQMKEDKLRNRIHLIVDKYRYGKSGSNFPLFMAPEISYIGDRSISLVGEKLDNCKENQYTEQVE